MSAAEAETYRIVKARVYRDMANEIFRHLYRLNYQEVVNSINVLGERLRNRGFDEDRMLLTSQFMQQIDLQKSIADTEKYWELVKLVPKNFNYLNPKDYKWIRLKSADLYLWTPS
jgi:hypothetical protein